MCSRNGRPVSSLAAPCPSKFTATVIRVSLVSRVTLAARSGTAGSGRDAKDGITERILAGSTRRASVLQRGEEHAVLIRRADRDAQTVAQRAGRVQILNKDAGMQ